MTLILGIEEKERGRSFLFSDSGIWRNGDHGATLTARKLWRSNGWIAGAAGSWEMCQAVQRIEMPPWRSDEITEGDATGLLLGWIETVYDRCGDISARVKKVDGDTKYGTPSLVVARGGLVFEVEETGVCRTTLGYAAAGVWTYAIGAMSMLTVLDETSYDAERRGRLACKAVCAITDACRAPFHWLCTDGSEGTFGEWD